MVKYCFASCFTDWSDFFSFIMLQARFMKLMNEKASLIERIQELEHVTVQLSHETETIGELVHPYGVFRALFRV